MFRLLYVTLTIASLLVCPYRCLGHLAGQCASAQQSPRCKCCQHRQRRIEQPERSAPAAPAEDRECRNCVCHGAILPAKIVQVLPASDVVAPLEIVSVAAQGSAGIDAARVADAGSWPTPPPGRTIRLKIESLQV